MPRRPRRAAPSRAPSKRFRSSWWWRLVEVGARRSAESPFDMILGPRGGPPPVLRPRSGPSSAQAACLPPRRAEPRVKRGVQSFAFAQDDIEARAEPDPESRLSFKVKPSRKRRLVLWALDCARTFAPLRAGLR